MKSKFGREMLLLTLPFLIIGGVAWWKGESVRVPSLNVAGALKNARRPGLTLKSVQATWQSPNSQAFMPAVGDCEVTATVIPSINALQMRPSAVPRSVWFDVVDEKGRSIKAQLGQKRRFSKTTTYKGISSGTSWRTLPGAGQIADAYEVSWQIPFRHLAATTRSVRLKARIGWGNARPVPVEFECLPPWMRKTSRRLQIESVVWQPAAGGTGGTVAVNVMVKNARALFAYGISKGGTTGGESLSITYQPFENRFGTVPKGEAGLLIAWSERVESGDGRLNSINALAAYMESEGDRKSAAAMASKSHSWEVTARGFAPLISVSMPKTAVNRAHIEYQINSIPRNFKNPVFRAEIWVEGDGKAAISCPLTAQTLR